MVKSFSPSRNPNGVWSWGFTRDGRSVTMAIAFMRAGMQGWGSPNSPSRDFNPSVLFNTSGTTIRLGETVRFLPGELGLHPGSAEGLVLRFTSPISGKFNIDATFTIKDYNGVVITVIRNGYVLATGTTMPSPFHFFARLALEKNECVDFLVEAGRFGCTCNTTSASVTVTLVE